MRSSNPGVRKSYRGTPSNRLALDNSDIRHLAAAIITQAVEDWIYCIRLEDMQVKGLEDSRILNYRRSRAGSSNYIEIRQFFHSDYGDMLCGMLDLSPSAVLERLETWLREYREDGKIPKYAWSHL